MRRGRRGSQRVRYWVWPLRTTGVIHQGNSQGSALGGCEGCPGCPCRDTQPPTPPGAQGAVSALRGGGQAAAGRRGVGREASRPAGAARVPPAAPHGCPASGRCTDAGPQQSQDLNPHLRGLCLATNSLIRSLTRSQEEKVGLRCPCRQVFDLGSPLQGTPPNPATRKNALVPLPKAWFTCFHPAGMACQVPPWGRETPGRAT